jgi:uncharacterized protein YutE (UPF0331/DUF86 family)
MIHTSCGNIIDMNIPKSAMDYEPYVLAITDKIEQYLCGLDELSTIFKQRPLSFNERSATERSLQVIVEAAIGCSKHLLKSKGKPVPSEARANIERTYELLGITNPPIRVMRGAIGMRNAIIHDYLNLDWEVIEDVLKEQKYYQIHQYIQHILDILTSGDKSYAGRKLT